MIFTADFYFRLLIGHLVGDYLLQNNWMALNKKEKWKPCVVHCILYTISVVLFTFPEFFTLDLVGIIFYTVIIFLSHVVLDKTSLIQYWLQFIKGRSFENAIKYCESDDNPEMHKQFMVSFTAVVYTIADNTVHLVLMYVGFLIVEMMGAVLLYIIVIVLVFCIDQAYTISKKRG